MSKYLPKILPAKVATQRRFVQSYVALLSGLLRLTDTELLVLVELVWKLYIGKDKADVFSPEGRKEIREKLSKPMSVHNFNNYLMALKRKKAITERNGVYDINPYLYPRKEITFTYEVYEDITKYLQS